VRRDQFARRVAAVLNALRPGDVVTYGEVAREAGYPRAARAVGGFLARSDGYPWWRVVTTTGRLVPGHEAEQARRLREEGVEVRGGRVQVRIASEPVRVSGERLARVHGFDWRRP
jgi:methylated-DNA-protein-cysteine methyltransferase related protein